MRILFLAAIASVFILAPVNASIKQERSEPEEPKAHVRKKPKSELPRPDPVAFEQAESKFRGFISGWEEVKDDNGVTFWKNTLSSGPYNKLEEIKLLNLNADALMTLAEFIELYKSSSEK